MTDPLTPRAVELASAANYAVFTTLLPSGQPQTHVMWVDTDGEHILINTLEGRRKLRNVEADPRVTVTIINGTDFFDWVEIRGRVVDRVRGQAANDHIQQLSRQYFGSPFGGPATDRVILKIAPERIVEHVP